MSGDKEKERVGLEGGLELPEGLGLGLGEVKGAIGILWSAYLCLESVPACAGAC